MTHTLPALALFLALLAALPAAAQDAPPQTFKAFLEELWPDAQAKGVTRATFDLAFAGVTPDARVMGATRRQPEYGKPFGGYIALMVSPGRISTGKSKASEWADTLAAVEKAYEVDPSVIVAIWGVESSYGAGRDKWDVIRSVATLAHARWRHPYFRNELLAALTVLQGGHIARRKMLGSWAGAMGQTQFMPSNFMDLAVDFSGDGKRDIWTNVPDVLGSTANYFKRSGWKAGLPWGFEVVVPKDFDYRKSRASFTDWQGLGLKRADGGAWPDAGEAILFFPTGAAGPAFLVTENFVTIKRFNNSDVYALAVGHLADRIRGGGPIRTAWPPGDRQLTREERIAVQKKLVELGYKVRNVTGHFDFDLRDHIREVQTKFGMVADGHPSAALLERLGVKRTAD